MVFENVTLFELHFDDARFGGVGDPTDRPASGRRRVPAAAHDERSAAENGESESDSGGSGVGRVLKLAAATAVIAVAVALVSRRAGGEDETGPVDVGPEPTLSEDAGATGSTTDLERDAPSADETP